MRQLITAGRIRRILSDAITDADAVDLLRCHRVRFSFSTAGGTLHIQIPTVSGILRVYRAEETAPAVITGPGRGPSVPAWYRPPVLHADI